MPRAAALPAREREFGGGAHAAAISGIGDFSEQVRHVYSSRVFVSQVTQPPGDSSNSRRAQPMSPVVTLA